MENNPSPGCVYFVDSDLKWSVCIICKPGWLPWKPQGTSACIFLHGSSSFWVGMVQVQDVHLYLRLWCQRLWLCLHFAFFQCFYQPRMFGWAGLLGLWASHTLHVPDTAKASCRTDNSLRPVWVHKVFGQSSNGVSHAGLGVLLENPDQPLPTQHMLWLCDLLGSRKIRFMLFVPRALTHVPFGLVWAFEARSQCRKQCKIHRVRKHSV